jgi:hypothetical protein
VELTLGQVISEPGCELGYAYFPLTAIVSLLYVMNDGESAEIALVGKDGMLGITLFMGGNSTTIRAVVQSVGQGYRLPASELGAEVGRGGATLRLLLLYTQSLVTQMTQTAACNRHHTLNQQFSRWLLLSFDRLRGDEMVMTQKLISKMLGVRSDEVTAGGPGAECEWRHRLSRRAHQAEGPLRAGSKQLRVPPGRPASVRSAPAAGGAGELMRPRACSARATREGPPGHAMHLSSHTSKGHLISDPGARREHDKVSMAGHARRQERFRP